MATRNPKSKATTEADVQRARLEARKAKAEAVKAKAEAAKVKAKAVSANQLGGFVTFIREKGVVGLAVGLAIGTAATGVVTQIVASVVTPTVSLLIGDKGLKGLNFVAKRTADGTPLVTYAVGDLIDALIKFLAVAAVIYFVIMGLKLDKLDKKKDA